jgi:hypothetical protein
MLVHTVLVHKGSEVVVLRVSSADEAAGVARLVATQTEQLMFLANKLQLPALQQKLQGFMSLSVTTISSLMYGYLGHVVTDRVLEAGTADMLPQQLATSSMVTQRGGFRRHMRADQVLDPLNLTYEQQAPMTFKAKLTRDAFSHAKGDTVSVRLDLFGEEPRITINSVLYVVQLLVGTHVWDEQSLQAAVGPGPVAAAESQDEA